MVMIANGVKQWIFQRIANVAFVVFGVCLLCIFLSDNGLSYNSLTELFSSFGFKLYFFITLLLAAVNGALAGWQIDGDYAKKFGFPASLITIVAIVVGVFYLVYGFGIIF